MKRQNFGEWCKKTSMEIVGTPHPAESSNIFFTYVMQTEIFQAP